MKHFELGIKREKAITNPEKGCIVVYCYEQDTTTCPDDYCNCDCGCEGNDTCPLIDICPLDIPAC